MSKETIMIVEDEAMIAANIQKKLMSAGYSVLPPVSTGKDALAMVDDQHPDLVLIDIQLIGKMTGINVAEQIIDNHDIPIIYLTAHSDNALIEQARLTEPYGYLIKPIHPKELLAAIKVALYKHTLARKLRESEEKYRAVVTQAYDSILIFDYATKKLLEANTAFRKLFKYSEEDIHSLTIYDIIVMEPNVFQHQIEKVSTGHPYNFGEQQCRCKDKSEINAEISSGIIEQNGKDSIICIIIHDVTERKQAEEKKKALEERLWQVRKAESLDRMAGAIAHSFNNQLHVVMGNLEMAMKNLQADAPQRQNLTNALQAARRSAETSGLLLTYIGQRMVKAESIDLSNVCRRNLPSLQSVIAEKIALEIDFMDTGLIVCASVGQMQQVITNLITNAVEAIDGNSGKIMLAARTMPTDDIPESNLIPPDWRPAADSCACLEVTDSGCGIATKDMDKIFDPFFSTKFTGRGLGLAVILGITRQWEGAISVESREGYGTTFRVFFPIVQDAVSLVPQKDTEVKPMTDKRSVLLVDDDDMVLDMTEQMLKRLGHSVIAAQGGIEAIELFNRHQDEIVCVITDLTMPGMDGWETISALRRICADIPIILASGYDEAHVMDGRQSGRPQVFLHKYYTLVDLKAALAAAMNTL